MGSLGDSDRLAVEQFDRSADMNHVDADAMKHMVMGIIAVALVFATIIGTVVLSDMLHILSSFVCSSVDLPSPAISG